MSLLARKVVRKPLPERRYFACSWEGYRTAVCRGLCPVVGGMGSCGRVAVHDTPSRIQLAILQSRDRA